MLCLQLALSLSQAWMHLSQAHTPEIPPLSIAHLSSPVWRHPPWEGKETQNSGRRTASTLNKQEMTEEDIMELFQVKTNALQGWCSSMSYLPEWLWRALPLLPPAWWLSVPPTGCWSCQVTVEGHMKLLSAWHDTTNNLPSNHPSKMSRACWPTQAKLGRELQTNYKPPPSCVH